MDYESDEHFRLAVLNGLLAALTDWASLAERVAGASDREKARASVCEMLGVDEEVAEHVLDIPLRYLTVAARAKIETERDLVQQGLATP